MNGAGGRGLFLKAINIAKIARSLLLFLRRLSKSGEQLCEHWRRCQQHRVTKLSTR